MNYFTVLEEKGFESIMLYSNELFHSIGREGFWKHYALL